MGVLAPGSAHRRQSTQPPINMSRNFSPHMSGGGGVLFYINFLSKKGNFKNFLFFRQNNFFLWGVGGKFF